MTLKITHKLGEWATIACNDCGDELTEQWTFQADTLREWAAQIREAHVCKIDDDEENEDDDTRFVNAELERIDSRLTAVLMRELKLRYAR